MCWTEPMSTWRKTLWKTWLSTLWKEMSWNWTECWNKRDCFLSKQMDKLAERLLELLKILFNMTRYPAFFRNNHLQRWKHMTSQSIRAILLLMLLQRSRGHLLKLDYSGWWIYRCLCWNIVGVKWPQLFSEFAMEFLQMGTKRIHVFWDESIILMKLGFDALLNRALNYQLLIMLINVTLPVKFCLGFCLLLSFQAAS